MEKKLPGILFDQTNLKKIEDRVYEQTVALSAKGRKIVGVYCAFTPKELITAANAIPVSLCSGSEKPFRAAEEHLPANLCPLIKSSYGHAVADTCPYFHMADFILADATCDGKKKMFELLSRIKPLHLLLLPQSADSNECLEYWKKELYKVICLLEKRTGNTITKDNLHKQIQVYNNLRRTVEKVFQLNTHEIPWVYGSEIDVIISMGGFECCIETRISEMETAMEQLRQRSLSKSFLDQMQKRPRILFTGCPNTNKKVLHLIEKVGGVVVAMETCGGLKSTSQLVSEYVDPIHALAERYLNIACACMTPNTRRIELIGKLIDQFKVDGVIDLTWNACHTYNVEAFQIKEALQQRFKKGYLQIVTDYSENDIGQLETRIEAFLEMLGS
ncbi:MAG: 2-hydroxyacyl-CoA dehydratase [Desulfobacterales bacterium]|nr:2-hydroxyacyl-CoA dehydratase [Desulfobacterales bacterium]